jgi:hypothetical protein
MLTAHPNTFELLALRFPPVIQFSGIGQVDVEKSVAVDICHSNTG